MNLNTIYTGDAQEVLRTLPDDSVDCCITSPPYWGLRDYGVAGQLGQEDTPAVYVAKLLDVFREVRRVLKPAGTLWLNIGDSYNGNGKANGCDLDNYHVQRSNKHLQPTRIKGLKPKDLIGIPWMMAFALRDSGWYLRQDIIWHKPNPMPESTKDRCTKSHEYIFLFSKYRKYYYDYEAIQEDSVSFADMKRRVKNGFGEWKTKKANSTYSVHNSKSGGRSREELYNKNGKRNKRSVWIVKTKPYKAAHFATYPEALIIDCVKAGCPVGGVVLDPFFGAGTTGIVAQNTGRNYVGIELNAEYVEIANKRISGGV
jgi:DNA modification methylase